MLEFLIGNILYVVFGNQVFKQSVGIPMGTNVPHCYQTFFCILMKQNLLKKTCTWKNKSLVVAFNSTFRYIYDVLSINNCYFLTDVDSIYLSELEIKDTTASASSISYLDILLEMDIDGNLTTKLYDKRVDFNFFIVSLPYLCSNIPS